MLALAAALVCPLPAQDAPPAAAPPQDPEIYRMIRQAITSQDPEEQIRLYDKVLEKDPANSYALTGLKEAEQALEKKRAGAAEQHKKEQEHQEVQARGRAALRAAEQAAYLGNWTFARQKLTEARSLGQAGADLTRVDGMVSRAERMGSFRRSLGFGAAGALVLGLVVWIISLFRPGKPYVELMTGAMRGRRYPVDKELLTVGALAQRGEEKNDIVVSDPEKTISRFHCEIHRKGRKCYVVDCNSANGTKLDGRLIPPGRLVPLPRGSQIQLGATCTLKFGFERRKR